MYKLEFILLHVWTQEENFIVRTKVASMLSGTLQGTSNLSVLRHGV